MPNPGQLTEEQKKALIKKVYTNAGIEVPEAEIERRQNDPTLISRHEAAKAAMEKFNSDFKRLKEEFHCGEKGISRLLVFAMNTAKTDEARNENNELYKSISTPAGIQALVNRYIQETLNQDMKELIPTSPEEMAEKYAADPFKYQRLWAVCYIVDNLKGANYTIDEPILSALKEKTRIVQNAAAFEKACNAYADDDWAYLTQNHSAEQWNKIATEMVSGDSFKQGTEEEQKYLAEFAPIAAGLEDAVKSKLALNDMNKKGMLEDGQTYTINNESYTRSQIQHKLSEKEIDNLDNVVISKVPQETIQQINDKKNSLITDAVELAILQGRAARKEARKPKYQAILDYHKAAFNAAGVPLPTVEQLQERSEDPEMNSIHEMSKNTVIHYDNKYVELEKQFPKSANLDKQFDRIYRYLLDASGTEEAFKYNLQLQALSATTQGQQIILNRAIKMLMDKPDDFFIPRDVKDASSRYCSDPALYHMAWASRDILNAMTIDGITVDPDVKTAFEGKKVMFQNGVIFKNAAEFMGRDDWALFDSNPISGEQIYAMLINRSQTGAVNNDPYNIMPAEQNRLGNDTIMPAYSFRYSDAGILPMINIGRQLYETNPDIFKNGAKITHNDVEVNSNSLIESAYSNGIGKIKVTYDQEFDNRVKSALSNMNDNIMSVKAPMYNGLRDSIKEGMATSGISLASDMKSLFTDLDSVNHGFFKSSPEFTRVINTVKAISEGRYSQDKAAEAFKEIITQGEQYIRNKKYKSSFTDREKNRLNAITKAVNDISARMKTIESRHAQAQQAHEHMQKRAGIPDNEVKTVSQLRKDEYVRDPALYTPAVVQMEVERLSQKFNCDKITNAEDYDVVHCLNPKQLEERLTNPEVMRLHRRALIVKERLKEVKSDANGKYKIGIGDPDMDRIIQYFMDYSGTPQAEEHNRLIAGAASTPEGCKVLMSTMAYKLLSDPVVNEAMTATTYEEAITAFEKSPLVCDMVFNSGNISNFTKYLDEPLKTAYLDQKAAWEAANFCQVAVDFCASDVYLAYDDFPIGPDSYMHLNNLQNTLIEIDPSNRAIAVPMMVLSLPNGPQKVLKNLVNNKNFKLENQFTDKNGKHLSTEQAAEAIEAAKGDISVVTISKRPNADKLALQIEKLNVGEPLQIGHDVLDGRTAGVLGCMDSQNFNHNLDKINKTLNVTNKLFPGQYSADLDDSMQYIESMKTKAGEELSIEQIHQRFEDITHKLNKIYESLPSSKSEHVISVKSSLGNGIGAAQWYAKKASFIMEHKAYEEKNGPFERNNGAYSYVKKHVEGQKKLKMPEKLKNIMNEFVQVSEKNYGQRFNDLPDNDKQSFALGIAGSLIINRMEIEKKQSRIGEKGPLTKIVSQGDSSLDIFCNAMIRVKDFSDICSEIMKHPEQMNTLLHSPDKLDKVLDDYVLGATKKITEIEKEKDIKHPKLEKVEIIKPRSHSV